MVHGDGRNMVVVVVGGCGGGCGGGLVVGWCGGCGGAVWVGWWVSGLVVCVVVGVSGVVSSGGVAVCMVAMVGGACVVGGRWWGCG